MRDRFFLFLYVEDEQVEDYLNIAVYLANPHEKWPAHVTVAGPYTDRRSAPKRKPFDQDVSVVGVGQFRSPTQNTIFLKIESPGLEKHWYKPDYGFNPHMTIYDGPDAAFATELFSSLSRVDPHFTFRARELERVRSTKGQASFELYSRVKFAKLRELGNIDPKRPIVSKAQRIPVITAAIRKAEASAHGPPALSVAAG